MQWIKRISRATSVELHGRLDSADEWHTHGDQVSMTGRAGADSFTCQDFRCAGMEGLDPGGVVACNMGRRPMSAWRCSGVGEGGKADARCGALLCRDAPRSSLFFSVD